MTVLDANLLLYAYNADAPQHARAAEWLNRLLESGDMVGLPWVTIWAFLRICTNARLWARPMEPARAVEVIGQWLDQPGVVALQPGPRHGEILGRLVQENAATGPLVSDAVLAALALENGAVLASSDQDFRRFTGLRWVNPLSA